jgi:hypothetical protein
MKEIKKINCLLEYSVRHYQWLDKDQHLDFHLQLNDVCLEVQDAQARYWAIHDHLI